MKSGFRRVKSSWLLIVKRNERSINPPANPRVPSRLAIVGRRKGYFERLDIFMQTRSVKLTDIRIDGGTQTRVSLDTETVAEYAEKMEAGVKFPAVVVFYDGSDYWMADGFHRFHSSRQCGYLDILAEVRTGTRIDALKYALGANRDHALKRSNADKRRCVEIALREFGGMSDRAISEMCGVSNDFVSRHRPQLSLNDSSTPKTRTGLDGKTRKMPERKPEPAKIQLLPETEPEPIAPSRGSAPSMGLQYATMAIMQLEKINPLDSQRIEAGQEVIRWINANLIK